MANYTITKELPTDPRYVSNQSEKELAKTNTDLRGLITAYNLADTALTALQAKYAAYFQSISLLLAREVDANGDVANIAANGGILASDTTPILQSNSPASDGDNAQVIVWAASNNDPIVFQVNLPPDIDVTADLVLHFRIKSAGTTDAVGFAVESWFNDGDTKIADTSGTNQTATTAEVIATIAAADIPAGAQSLTFTLAPVAHTTDIMYLYGVWIEATRLIS